jgi:hypothetical protein
MNLDADVHFVGLKTTWDRTDQCRITVTPSSKRRVNRVLKGLRHATEEAWIILQAHSSHSCHKPEAESHSEEASPLR